MTNPLLEVIERCESTIANNEKEIKRLKKKAEDHDGDLTEADPEWDQIDTIRKRTETLEQQAGEKRREFEANKAEWEGLSGDVSDLVAKLQTLKDWGEPGAAAIDSTLATMRSSVDEDCYRAAINSFGDAKSSITPLMEEYERQSAAKETYDQEYEGVEQRLEQFREEEVYSDITTSGLPQIETNLDSASAPTDQRNYVEALELLRLGNPEIARLEAEFTRLNEAKTATEENLETLEARMSAMDPGDMSYSTDARTQAMQDVQSRFDTVRENVNTVQNLIATCEFTDAQSNIDTNDYELDAIETTIQQAEADEKAELERIEAEREAWQAREHRWTELQTQTDELQEWDDPTGAGAAGARDTIQRHLDAEEYPEATEALEAAEDDIRDGWNRHLEQVAAKGTFDSVIGDLEQRAVDARAHEFADDTVIPMIDSTDTALARMRELAGSKDYIAANDETATVNEALDQVDQALREAQIRAEVEAEMGHDGESSDPDVENAIQERLYTEERAALEQRVADAGNIDVAGGGIREALDQLQTDMDSAQGIADGGDFAGAVEAVRTSTQEMGRVDEVVRDQLELKSRFDRAFADMTAQAGCLVTCELATISDQTQNIIDGSEEAMTLADAGDYETALQQVTTAEQELDALDRQEADLHAQKDEATEKLSRLAQQIEAVQGNEYDDVQSHADLIMTKVGNINDMMTSENYEGAITAIGELEPMLTEFAEEAEIAKQYQNYQDALASLDIETGLMDMRSCIYPEAEEDMASVEAKETERLTADSGGDWKAACDATYKIKELLDIFDGTVAGIDASREYYELNSPTALQDIEDLVPDGVEENKAEIDKIKADVEEIKTRMETAADASRFIEAHSILSELAQAISVAQNEIRDLLQANDSTINEFIKNKADIAKNSIFGGMLTAINTFKIDIVNRVTSERDFQKEVRRAKYQLDVGAAIAGCLPGAGAIVGAIFSSAATAAEATATEIDDAMDAEDNRIADLIAEKLHEARRELDGNWISDCGPWFKTNKPDAYKEIGNYLYGDNSQQRPSEAAAVLTRLGLPTQSSQSQFYDYFYKDLTKQFNAQRG